MRRGIKGLGVFLCSGLMVTAAHAGTISESNLNAYTQLNLTNVVDALQFTTGSSSGSVGSVPFDAVTTDGLNTTPDYGPIAATNTRAGFGASTKFPPNVIGVRFSFPANNSGATGSNDTTIGNNPLEQIASAGWQCGDDDPASQDGDFELDLPVALGHSYEVQMIMVGFQAPGSANDGGNYFINSDTATNIVTPGQSSGGAVGAAGNGTDYTGVVTDSSVIPTMVTPTTGQIAVTIAWDSPFQGGPGVNTPYMGGIVVNDLGVTPEPASLSLIGIAGLGLLRRRARA